MAVSCIWHLARLHRRGEAEGGEVEVRQGGGEARQREVRGIGEARRIGEVQGIEEVQGVAKSGEAQAKSGGASKVRQAKSIEVGWTHCVK
jgi:hypothetical protein